jgi:hypothetical protein
MGDVVHPSAAAVGFAVDLVDQAARAARAEYSDALAALRTAAAGEDVAAIDRCAATLVAARPARRQERQERLERNRA